MTLLLSFRPRDKNLRGSRIKPGMTWLSVAFFLLPIIAFAQDKGIVTCGPQQEKLCELADLFKLLVGIYNFLLGMAGIVAFGFLIYGGIRMFLYSVDEENLAAGKKTIIEALIGLAIVAMAYLLVNTLLSALGVESSTIGDYFSGKNLQ